MKEESMPNLNSNLARHPELAEGQTCDPVKIEERLGVSSEALNTPKLQRRSIAKEGYKQTKLGWIPEEWETPRIDEMFDFLSTNSFSRNQLNYEDEEGVYNIHYGDIHATYKQPLLDFEKETTVPKINRDIDLSKTTDFLKDGDLVIADASEDYEGVGEAIELKNINGKKVISGLHTFAFRDKANETAEGFRVYIFRNPIVKKALKTIATGSKVYGISKGNIQKFRIVLPPLPEQQKIATILSTWDTAIAKQQQLIAAKQQYKKGLMQLLLTGEKRFDGFEGEWEESKLGNHCNVLMCKRIFSNETSDIGDIPFYKIGTVGKKADAFISRKLFQEYKEKYNYPRLNEILITCSGTVGKCISYNGEDAYFQDSNIVWLDNSENEIDNKFLYYLISNFDWNKLNSTTITRIYTSDLKSMRISFPGFIEQQKIASILSAADKEIELLQTELGQLQGQKRGLMQRLLTGAVRVKR